MMGMACIWGGAIIVMWVIFIVLVRGSRDVVGGDGVTVVSRLVFMGTVVDMVLVEFADLVLCVVSLFFNLVCFSSSRNSERVLESVGTSHSVYDLV